MSHLKVKQRIFVRSELGYVDDCIEIELRIATFKRFKKYCKSVTKHMNQKHRKVITMGGELEAHTLRIEDIESISYEIEMI